MWKYYFDNLVKGKKLEAKKIIIDEKNYKDLVIYFTRYVHSKSIKTSSPYCHELMEKVQEHEGKKYFIVNYYMLGKVLDRIKEIKDIEKLDNTKVLIDMDDELSDDIT